MKFQIKQKLLAIGDDFEVLDENGNAQFLFDGKIGSLTKKLVVYDSSKSEIGILTKRLTSFLPTFDLKKNGETICTIWKKAFTFRPGFHIEMRNGDPITATGKMIEHDFRFFRDGREIATVSKAWFRAKDTYGVEIDNPSDYIIILSASIVIDLILYPKRDST